MTNLGNWDFHREGFKIDLIRGNGWRSRSEGVLLSDLLAEDGLGNVTNDLPKRKF